MERHNAYQDQPMLSPSLPESPTIRGFDQPNIDSLSGPDNGKLSSYSLPAESHSHSPVLPSPNLPTSMMDERIDSRDYGGGNADSSSAAADTAFKNAQRTTSPLAISTANANAGLNDIASPEGTTPEPPTATSTTNNRRSVQFTGNASRSHSRQPSWEDPDPSRHIGSSFMSKLKSLSLQSPRSTGGLTDNSAPQSRASSPTNARTPRLAGEDGTGALEDADADADAEETADEALRDEDEAKKDKKKKRKSRRPRLPDWASSPNTSGMMADGPSVPLSAGPVMRRQTSIPALNESSQRWSAVVSEGEGRERLEKKKRFSKRSSSYWQSRASGTEGGPPRQGHMRRLTSFGAGMDISGAVSDADGMATPRRATFFSHERAATLGAQGWNMVKSTLKMLRSKRDDRMNLSKSAELISELQAGAPAAMLLATYMQRDEHGNKRIPVLLEQLQLQITDSKHRPEDDSERHSIFTISLTYGSGPSSMQWKITRTLSDIYQLHLRYRMKTTTGRQDAILARYKQPKFPWAIFPWFRSFRSHGDESDEEEPPKDRSPGAEDGIVDDQPLEEPPRIHDQRGHARSQSHSRHQSLANFTDEAESGVDEAGGTYASQLAASDTRRRHVNRQRKALERYLQEMIKWLMIRPDSNRMCRFLELSALGVRLAAEGSHHGKECYLHIQSSKGLDFRRVLTPGKMIARHSRKWFLVRQSYIVCVESPENMNVYDVYLVDADFEIGHKRKKKFLGGSSSAPTTPALPTGPIALDDDDDSEKGEYVKDSGKHHRLTLRTSERKVKLFSRNHMLIQQFEESLREMLATTPWHQPNRFGSFGPVRQNVYAQWLVDGRDYMWNVSRAIQMARDVIYIHDWWLSPELYMRRPAAISQKWRLDRLLQRKAQEGVKIFVIVYRNVEAAVPIDSTHTKFSLLNLHPNIFIQRSPHQFKKNQFIYAHHEKLVIVDHDIAFLGGIDLCFGRWDSPQHPLTDDRPTGFEPMPEDAGPLQDPGRCQMFPGKDYSNPRVQDFYRLNEPYEEMYDRSRVPRMPWHDVAMQVVGQPARDLTRHFVQRWNYIRRGRKATRPLPFLLPPPDAKPEQLEALGLTGTCEVQLLRSAGNWSLGTSKTEHSIQNAYIKMIEESEHFVYMENQFFVTSTEFDGVQIMNRIGDALVARAIKAHRDGEDWKCVVIIPLMPGFQNTVDNPEGTSIRLILESQYRSICRGDKSIFGRLSALNINPEDYIQFFSLRQWGKMDNGVLVTEQLYIHAKIIIVDDRVALIGSANINERSMLGDRDSEVAAVIRDTDMIDSTMAGRPFQVGRFAHTLRMRLMREHLGLDVDEILEEDMANLTEEDEGETDYTATESMASVPEPEETVEMPGSQPPVVHTSSFNRDAPSIPAEASEDSPESPEAAARRASDVAGFGPDRGHQAEISGANQGRDSVVAHGHEVLVHSAMPEGHGTVERPLDAKEPPRERRDTDRSRERRPSAISNFSAHGPSITSSTDKFKTDMPASSHPLAVDITPAAIDRDCMQDPIIGSFLDDVWNRAADNNTKLYRRVFRCMPDNEVSTWNEYREYTDYAERFRASMENSISENRPTSSNFGHISHQVIDLDAAAKAANAARHSVLIEDPAISNTTGTDTASINQPPTNSNNNNNGPAPPRLRVPLNVDTSAASASASATSVVDHPSPVLPAGDTPFPPLDPSITLPPATPTAADADRDRVKDKRATFSMPDKPVNLAVLGNDAGPAPGTSAGLSTAGTLRKRKRTNTKSSRHRNPHDLLPQAEAEELLSLMQGNLVQFPYDWLLTEENKRNWGYQVDHVAPLQIYI